MLGAAAIPPCDASVPRLQRRGHGGYMRFWPDQGGQSLTPSPLVSSGYRSPRPLWGSNVTQSQILDPPPPNGTQTSPAVWPRHGPSALGGKLTSGAGCGPLASLHAGALHG